MPKAGDFTGPSEELEEVLRDVRAQYHAARLTGVACVMEGRRFLGIELSSEYADMARRRIADAQPGLGL